MPKWILSAKYLLRVLHFATTELGFWWVIWTWHLIMNNKPRENNIYHAVDWWLILFWRLWHIDYVPMLIIKKATNFLVKQVRSHVNCTPDCAHAVGQSAFTSTGCKITKHCWVSIQEAIPKNWLSAAFPSGNRILVQDLDFYRVSSRTYSSNINSFPTVLWGIP